MASPTTVRATTMWYDKNKFVIRCKKPSTPDLKEEMNSPPSASPSPTTAPTIENDKNDNDDEYY